MKVGSPAAAVTATISRIASRQLGVVTRAQLLGIGLSARSIEYRLDAGALEALPPIGRGVYRVAGTIRSWEQLAVGATLVLGEGAVLSHTSAARVWDLDAPRHQTVELSIVAASRPMSRDGVAVHRVRVLERRDRTRMGPFRLTTVARTLVDLATRLGAAQLARSVDDAVCRGLVTPAALVRTSERLGARGRRGSATFRDVLAPWLGETVPDSVAETAFLRLVSDGRLPAPLCQHEVFDRGRFVARPDFVWPDQMVAVQVDGYRWHSSPRSFAKDARQTNDLMALGWKVLHVPPVEVRDDPGRVLDLLRCALAKRP
jgi:very-short-patch-repair endonuclease